MSVGSWESGVVRTKEGGEKRVMWGYLAEGYLLVVIIVIAL